MITLPDLWTLLATAIRAVVVPSVCHCPICERERMRTAQAAEAAAEIDLARVLAFCHPAEVAVLREALARGLVEGRSSVTCLVGIVATVRQTTYRALPFAALESPIEEWTAEHIHAGMTPQSSADAARLDGWLAAWLEAHTLELAVAVLQE